MTVYPKEYVVIVVAGVRERSDAVTELRVECECTDRECRAHRGKGRCESLSDVIMYRVDMHDETGTAFCEECGDDAYASGLFVTESDADDA